jgi:protein gp37
MFAEPLSGFRQATARPQRTKVDWAVEVAALLDTRYADCDRVTLVCDNLNTHTMGAFYEAFEPERARQYVRRRGRAVGGRGDERAGAAVAEPGRWRRPGSPAARVLRLPPRKGRRRTRRN